MELGKSGLLYETDLRRVIDRDSFFRQSPIGKSTKTSLETISRKINKTAFFPERPGVGYHKILVYNTIPRKAKNTQEAGGLN